MHRAPTQSATTTTYDARTSSPPAVGMATGGVRWTLRAEGLAAFVAATALYAQTGRGWGLYALLFLAPDLTFIAFAAGPRAGAIAYDALHTTIAPLALALWAHLTGHAAVLPYALVWLAHCGFDRAAGYGLKYPTAFGDTHLGHKGPRRASGPAGASAL